MGLSFGALAAASAALPGGLLHRADAFAATSTPSTSLTPDQAIARLAAGNRRFVRGKCASPAS
jgi:hypothetical protein